MVPGVGLEPTRIATADFESAASTNSATRARGLRSAEVRGLIEVVNSKLRSGDSLRVYQISSPRSKTPSIAVSQVSGSRACRIWPAVAKESQASPEAKSLARNP